MSELETQQENVNRDDDGGSSLSSISPAGSTSYSTSPTTAAANISVTFDNPPQLIKPSLKKQGELGEPSGIETSRSVQWNPICSISQIPPDTPLEPPTPPPPSPPADPTPQASPVPEETCSKVCLYIVSVVSTISFLSASGFAIWIFTSGHKSAEAYITAGFVVFIAAIALLVFGVSTYHLRKKLEKQRRRQRPSEQSALIAKPEDENDPEEEQSERLADEAQTTAAKKAAITSRTKVLRRKLSAKGKLSEESSSETQL